MRPTLPTYDYSRSIFGLMAKGAARDLVADQFKAVPELTEKL